MKTLLALPLLVIMFSASAAHAQLFGESNKDVSKKLGMMTPIETVNGSAPLPPANGITRFAFFKDSKLVALTYDYKALGASNYPRSAAVEDLMRKVIGKDAARPTREIDSDTWSWKTDNGKYFASYDVKAMLLTIGLVDH